LGDALFATADEFATALRHVSETHADMERGALRRGRRGEDSTGKTATGHVF